MQSARIMNEIRELIKMVSIPACEEHEGLYQIKVKVYWVCPICKKTRGEIKQGRSYDGSLYLVCDTWENPCGHVDKYSAVREEAKNNGLNIKEEI